METLNFFAAAGPRELLNGASSAVLHAGFMDPNDAQFAFKAVDSETTWEQQSIFNFGRKVAQPRLVAWFADTEGTYRYSGLTLKANPFTPTLLGIKEKIEDITHAKFNSALANLYRNGDDKVGWHSDNEPEFGIDPVIASLSLGAMRRFDFRRTETTINRKGEREETKVTKKENLASGDLVVMSGASQREWTHRIPPQKK